MLPGEVAWGGQDIPRVPTPGSAHAQWSHPREGTEETQVGFRGERNLAEGVNARCGGSSSSREQPGICLGGVCRKRAPGTERPPREGGRSLLN